MAILQYFACKKWTLFGLVVTNMILLILFTILAKVFIDSIVSLGVTGSDSATADQLETAKVIYFKYSQIQILIICSITESGNDHSVHFGSHLYPFANCRHSCRLKRVQLSDDYFHHLQWYILYSCHYHWNF